MKNQDKLRSWKLTGKEKYYYLKYGIGAVDREDGFLGRACVCLLPCDGNTLLRGISFCNPLDLWRFSKKKARDIALGRAIKALEKGDSSEPIPAKAPVSIMRSVRLGGLPNRRESVFVLISFNNFCFLSEFNPELTDFEKRLLQPEHRKPTIKPVDELSQQDIEKIRLTALRASLHKAVDMGAYDHVEEVK